MSKGRAGFECEGGEDWSVWGRGRAVGWLALDTVTKAIYSWPPQRGLRCLAKRYTKTHRQTGKER